MASKKSLKNLKEEAELNFKEENYSLSLPVCEQIKEKYPKNYYGYFGIIKSKTNNYTKFVGEETLKEIKKEFVTLLECLKKNEKEKYELEFNEYLDDLKEVESLRKIRKELTSKFFLKSLYKDFVSLLNQNINAVSLYKLDGKKITNIYDLIKGMFLFCCLIFNIINPNYLLFLTIPFGIFGLIIIYSFISMNFLGKKRLSSEKDYVTKVIDESKEKIEELKKEIKKINENINFLNDQKNTTLSKIPETFMGDIKDYISEDEKIIARRIKDELSNNNLPSFTFLVNEETTLNVDDIFSKIKTNSKKEEESELRKFLSDKLDEKKRSQNKLIVMRKIKPYNYFILGLLLFISICSTIVIINNFYEINLKAFIWACFVGIGSAFIHNVKGGKHDSLTDTFNDNLLSTIFNATLVYDLIYMSITSELKFTYGFLEMPIIFILMFIGLVMLVSFFKYRYLLKKLRK